MLVLGIETTCDETSCSIVRDGVEILSHVIASQIALHNPFGGVVPELASRRHMGIIDTVCKQALQEAKVSLSDIDLISVAKGPGLIGALLVGINFAKGLSFSLQKPLIGINHIEAHLYAAMMHAASNGYDLQNCFPALGLVLSGGHASIVLIDDIGHYTLIGETVDDAIGEAFDKVAKILGLPYPGGPEIERCARGHNPKAYPFHKSRVKGRPLDFSFSGIKTNVLYTVRGSDLKSSRTLSPEEIGAIAASFQDTVFNDVADKTALALKTHKANALFLGGGVTQNRRLREILHATLGTAVPLFFPEDNLCQDNAAMIAGLAFRKWQVAPISETLSLEPETRMPF